MTLPDPQKIRLQLANCVDKLAKIFWGFIYHWQNPANLINWQLVGTILLETQASPSQLVEWCSHEKSMKFINAVARWKKQNGWNLFENWYRWKCPFGQPSEKLGTSWRPQTAAQQTDKWPQVCGAIFQTAHVLWPLQGLHLVSGQNPFNRSIIDHNYLCNSIKILPEKQTC